ncbi:hypothetical protein J4221_04275 [Candidatus Pacearchaeota archaeon]|nr:hypothetical protein [Candidatus Pacearchaeota archaeon]
MVNHFFYGYSIADLLNSWANMGVFAYLLPFLMIFALVYGILSRTQILGENKGVMATISLAFGLLALQFDYVSGFYASIFPYAGMGLAVLLVAIILMGLIAPEANWAPFVWFGIGVVIFLFVLLSSISDMFWLGGTAIGLVNAAPALLAVGLVLGIMALIIWGGGRGGGGGGGGGRRTP